MADDTASPSPSGDSHVEPSSRRSDRTRAAILTAARARFTSDGYERATIRSIAADAEIDPSMVIRYFGSKEHLFAEAVDIDLRLPDLAAVPGEELGRTLVEHFFSRWEGLPSNDAFLLLLRSAGTNENAGRRARAVVSDQVRHALARAVGERGEQTASLVTCQLLGLALGRYLLRLPGMADASPRELIDALAPCVQQVLTGP
jgi:AcrR family transcriptional regulator